MLSGSVHECSNFHHFLRLGTKCDLTESKQLRVRIQRPLKRIEMLISSGAQDLFSVYLCNHFKPYIDRKATRMGYKIPKSDFAAWQRPMTYSESGQRHHFWTWLGTLAPPIVLTRLDRFGLPLVFIDVSRTFHKTV